MVAGGYCVAFLRTAKHDHLVIDSETRETAFREIDDEQFTAQRCVSLSIGEQNNTLSFCIWLASRKCVGWCHLEPFLCAWM